MREPQVVRMPFVQMTSLTQTGTPVRGADLAAGDAGVGGVGLLEGELVGDADVRLHAPVDRADARQHGLGELPRRDVALAEKARGLVCGQIVEVQGIPPDRIAMTREAAIPGRRGRGRSRLSARGALARIVLRRKRGTRLVRAEDVLQRQRVRRRRHVLGVELMQDVEVVEDDRKLLLELDLVLFAEAQSRQLGQVLDFRPAESQVVPPALDSRL